MLIFDHIKFRIINPNSVLDKYGIDLRNLINGLMKPLKQLVHRDVPYNQHYTAFQNP
jgi:hypothetical protein